MRIYQAYHIWYIELFNIVNKKGLMELFIISRFECIFFLLWFLPRIICKITILTWPSRRWRSPWRRKRIRSIDVSIIQNNRRSLVIISWDIGRNIFVPRLSPFDTFANHKGEQNNDENKSNYNRQKREKLIFGDCMYSI